MIIHSEYKIGDKVIEFEVDTQKVHPMLKKNKDALYQIVFTPALKHPTFPMEDSVLLQDDGGRWFWAPYSSPEDYYVLGRGYTLESAAKEFVECEVMYTGDIPTYEVVSITLDELIAKTEERYIKAEKEGKCKIITP